MELNKAYLFKDSIEKGPVQMTVLRQTESSYLVEYMDGSNEWLFKETVDRLTLLEEI